MCWYVVGPPQKCDQPSATNYTAASIALYVRCPSNGNSNITEYEIQYYITAGNWTSVKFNASVSQPFIVKDLIPFTWYEVRVRAANKYSYEKGDVSFSDPVRVRSAEGDQMSVSYSTNNTPNNQWLHRSKQPMKFVVISAWPNPFSTYRSGSCRCRDSASFPFEVQFCYRNNSLLIKSEEMVFLCVEMFDSNISATYLVPPRV